MMNAPPIFRSSRTAISILSPSSRISSHQPVSLVVRLPPTHHRAFHSSPAPQLIHTLLSSTHDLFTGLHSITHLSWALTLPLSALLIRLSITLPLSLYTRRVQQQQLRLQPLLLSWSHHLRRQNLSKSGHLGPAVVERDTRLDIRSKRREVYQRWACQNWKNFLPVIQLPVWLTMVETIRAMAGTHKGLLGLLFSSSSNISEAGGGSSTTTTPLPPPPPPADPLTETAAMTDALSPPAIATATPLSPPSLPPEPSLATEGILWFPDLTVPDPMLILPFALSASMLLNLYMTPRRGRALALTSSSPSPSPSPSESSPLQRRITHVLGIMALAAGPLTLQIPSAVLLYWISSSLMGYVQAVLLDWWVPIRHPPAACKVSTGSQG